MARSCCFLWVWGLWLPLVATVAAAEEQGQGCSGRCGNLTISDPFWLSDPLTGRSCGSPDFEVACFENNLVLASAVPFSYGFSILNISYEKQSMQVVDLGKLRLLPDVDLDKLGPLPPGNICSQPIWNISAKLGIDFTIDPVNLNLTIYNCTKASPAAVAAARRDGKLVGMTMRCQNESKFFAGVDESYVLEGCDAVFLPVLGGANGTAMARNYNSLIQDGFILTWKPPPPLPQRGNFRLKIGAGIAAALLCLVLLSIVCIIHNIRRKRKRPASLDDLIISEGSLLASLKKEFNLSSPLTHIFTYEELSEATNGFSDARVIGAGGFGTVYKGFLRNGSVVAVKRLYKNSYKGVEQFANEVDILSRLRHPNLVAFYGCTSSSLGSCCHDLLLAYEFVSNGTLANHLNYKGEVPVLAWPTRLRIAVEAAGALAYLHAQQVVHRDVKTTNILLDKEFHVKMADFGLSRLFPTDATHVSTAPQGTPGYVDPVYHHKYHLTDKSDVYSFGVVLIELVSSRPAVDMSQTGTDVNLASMAVRMIQCCEIDKLVDPRLGYGSASQTTKTVDLVAEVAFRCLQTEQDVRPSISEVLDVLSEAHKRMMEKGDCTTSDDVVLLKKNMDGSPDSVMHQWISPSTTSNHTTSH